MAIVTSELLAVPVCTDAKKEEQKEHPLYFEIGRILGSLDQGLVLLDCACGGHGNVQLFCEHPCENKSKFCKADAVIVLNGEVKVFAEIEKSAIAPVNLCGKAVATALCTHAVEQRQTFPISKSNLFRQIISSDFIPGKRIKA